MRRFLFLVCFIVVSMTSSYAQRGFAIVVDPKSYKEAKLEIEQYAAAIEAVQGLKVYKVIDRWGVPDSIRAELIRLHTKKRYPIEGAVFIGDIPVAMIRDAQHLTSAFKMDQRRDRKQSSVPSDRFYDDFGLQFMLLGSIILCRRSQGNICVRIFIQEGYARLIATESRVMINFAAI